MILNRIIDAKSTKCAYNWTSHPPGIVHWDPIYHIIKTEKNFIIQFLGQVKIDSRTSSNISNNLTNMSHLVIIIPNSYGKLTKNNIM